MTSKAEKFLALSQQLSLQSPHVDNNTTPSAFKVYSFGRNSNNRLAVFETEDDIQLTSEYNPNQSLETLEIIYIVTGVAHGVAISKDGLVYTYGRDSISGIDQASSLLGMKKVPTLQHIIHVTAGDYHCLALDVHGRVYAWGINQNCECGTGQNVKLYRTPQLLPQEHFKNKKVIQIRSGFVHNLALTEDGDVFSCGDNCDGQLGLGLPRSAKAATFSQITANVAGIKFVQIASQNSSQHSLLLSSDGKVYACGDNEYGQCGQPSPNNTYAQSINVPKLVESLDPYFITYILTGQFCSFALSKDGKLLSFGKNIFGQLGTGDKINRYQAQEVKFESPSLCISHFAVGTSHVLCYTDTNKILSFGWNDRSQANGTDVVDRELPTPIDFEPFKNSRILRICASFGQTFVWIGVKGWYHRVMDIPAFHDIIITR